MKSRFPLIGVLLLIPALSMVGVVGCTKPADDKTTANVKTDATEATTPVTLTAIDKPTKGVVKGVVKYKGAPPVMDAIEPMKANKDCMAATDPRDLKYQKWRVDANSGVANVVVSLEPSAASKKKFKITDDLKAPFKEPAIMDQPFCNYHPHALAVYAGIQPVIFKNSAKFSHDVRIGASKENDGTFSVNSLGELKEKKFAMTSSGIVNISCNVHSWMSAKLLLFPHPYFAVTKDDGSFEIKNVPVDSELTVHIWHEELGKDKRQDITVKDGTPTELTLEVK